ETGLRQRDVVVLSITRDSVTIPNPRPDRVIKAGDTLLCYGKLITLKSLVPHRTAKQRAHARRRPKRSS
ncbi:MAG: cation:proton antiporter regulatory subunit, partial [Planctomycetota bacterium]